MKFILFCFLCITMNFKSNAEKRSLLSTDTVKRIKATKKQRDNFLALAKSWKPYYDDCVFTNQYAISQRLKKYPFSKAVKILAVSYPALKPPDAVIIIDGKNTDSLNSKQPIQNKSGLNIINGDLDYSDLKDTITLNGAQINHLTNIIFNTGYRKHGFNTISGGACYEPRNAIIFIDKDGKIYDYLEICFACEHYSSKSDRLTIGEVCTQKYEILRKYFINVGIKYGTKKNMHGD